ncbi:MULTISPECIES: acyl carrier protein [Streptosporangium]|uniref:Acyl carrier protein n=1 Tax=Streptosporangium brasiliense TaxID=47480 RepID=A0ABT9RF93_9ACTN|nr:acyl carrier protein [Streptosporangium brasiliense]MDP9867040.1 acyl carrier protein [Streptosporangium brasiliense]
MDNATTIKKFILSEFLPDVGAGELDSDYDLLNGGIVDSLGLLRVIEWLEIQFQLDSDTIELTPDNFRTINRISALVDTAGRA